MPSSAFAWRDVCGTTPAGWAPGEYTTAFAGSEKTMALELQLLETGEKVTITKAMMASYFAVEGLGKGTAAA